MIEWLNQLLSAYYIVQLLNILNFNVAVDDDFCAFGLHTLYVFELSWCVYFTFSIESNGPQLWWQLVTIIVTIRESCQEVGGVAAGAKSYVTYTWRWSIRSDRRRAVSSFSFILRPCLAYDVSINLGASEHARVGQFPWRHTYQTSSDWANAMSILVCAFYSSGWRPETAEHSRTAESK